MAKTIIGLFDNRAEAQKVVQELLEDGFRREDISIMSKGAEGTGKGGDGKVEYVEEEGHEQIEDMAKGAGTGALFGGLAGLLVGLTALAIPGLGPVVASGPLAAAIAGAGIGATAGGLISGLTRLGVPEEDANYFAEGVRRGGTLVSVNASDETANDAVAVMKHHGAVEIDKRAAQWRDEGWTNFDAETERIRSTGRLDADTAGLGARSDVTAEHRRIPTQQFDAGHTREISMPVVEERLEVGKREVERGGVRVESHVTETPVEQEVNLREERVNVERRPVDYTFHGSEMEAFKEAQVEIREAYEELIVNKKARVVEEVVIGKDVEQRTETVRETLRRTDVEVERIEPGRARGAGASTGQDDPQGGTGV
ncbi:MAG TPA: YsnF/AvaK domain-containing protein [Pyrinomonadaceae bacterium]|jgi:uncharacterized protein (TIGR02271 family)|nr:YsnF/AvaK domain-containing protein [Pyrinomonadaceae bacterium]